MRSVSEERTTPPHPKRQRLQKSQLKDDYKYPSCSVKSYFTHNKKDKEQKVCQNSFLRDKEKIVPLTVYDERMKLKELNSRFIQKGLPFSEYLLRRKLIVRQTKREYGLPVFNIDEEVKFIQNNGRPMTNKERIIQSYSKEKTQWYGGPASILDRYQVSGKALIDMKTKNLSFRERLTGTSECDFDFIDSPYSGRVLKPFIYRDFESKPPRLKLLNEIIHHARKNKKDLSGICTCPMPIDYRYVTPKHIPALNHLARTYFWEGIDLSEILQYPDFTCVVSYGKLVVGFGVIVPDTRPNEGYISYLLVHPEWRKAGIGKFMLYHLIQTCHGMDITLHVSATNNALILYQKFGFKVEEFLPNFYEKYLPYDDKECKHALFLRLHR
ncbi:UNVERIFIED_CONTAM: hypothetical protein RMT77_011899 [Armadillidium vulgare]